MPYPPFFACAARLAVLVFLIALPSGQALAFPLVQKELRIENLGNVGAKSIVTSDFDGDGVDDIAFFNNPGIEGTGMLTVVGGRGGNWSVLQLSAIEDQDVLNWSMRLMLWKKPGGNAVVAITDGDGDAPSYARTAPLFLVLEGWPLREVRRFSIPFSVSQAALGDVDGDGSTELVTTLYSGTTHAIDLFDGQIKWTLPNGGFDMELLNLDDDPVLEIVISGANGGIYDGATLQLDSPPPGPPELFPQQIGSAQINADGKKVLTLSRQSNRVAYDGIPLQQIWNLPGGFLTGHSAGDIDLDGRDELLAASTDGDDFLCSLFALDTNSAQSTNIGSSRCYYVSQIGAADLTGDGAAETYVGGYLLDSSIRIFNAQTGSLMYSAPKNADFSSTALGDVNADGRMDQVIGASSTRLVDYQTGQTQWEFTGNTYPLGPPGQWGVTPQRLRLVQLDTDPALEVVVAGYNSGGIVAHVLDGATGESQLEIRDFLAFPSFRYFGAMTLSDSDGDGVPELFLTTYSTRSSQPGPQLSVYSLLSGEKLFQSADLDPPKALLSEIAMVPNANDEQESFAVVALQYSLQAINASTFQPEWSLPWGEEITTMAVIDHAENGAEIVVAGASGRVVHLDPADRTARRSYVLPAPIYSIVEIPGRTELAFFGRTKLILVNDQGIALDESISLGPGYGGSSQIAVAAQGSRLDFAVTSRAALARFQFDPDAILIDGFD